MQSKNNRYSKAILVAIFFAAGLFTFQNCAPAKPNSGTSLDSLSIPAPPPVSPFSGLPPGLPPSNGSCSTPVTLNACAPGSTFVELPDSATQYLWSCNGSNGGSNSSCALNIVASQDPVCSATTNICVKGNVANIHSSATLNLWNCEGNAKSISCASAISGGGGGTPSCGSALNTCNNSVFSDLADSVTTYIWRCNGVAANCTLAKPASAVSCGLSVNPYYAHLNDIYTYKITAPSGITLPNPVNVKIYGTKAKPDGSGAATDANGETAYPVDPAGISLTNTGNAVAGMYTRHLILSDPVTNQDICTTTSVTHVLTPACSLTATPASITLNQTFTYAGSIVTTPALGGTPARLLWYGTKDGVVNEAGVDHQQTTFPQVKGPFPSTDIGAYTHYFEVVDSRNAVLCRSNTVSVTINALPVTTPNE